MARVIYSLRAKTDIVEIFNYYHDIAGEDTAKKVYAEIITQGKYLAENTMLGKDVPGLEGTRKEWLYQKRGIKFYYIRLGAKSIKVVRVWPTKRKPLSLDDIAQ